MTKRAPGFARAGRWRLTKMDKWEDLDLIEPAHITFIGNANSCLPRLRPISTYATDRATAPHAQHSPGRAPTTTLTPAAADGPQWAPQAASSGIFMFTRATIQASSPSARDFFNSLLEDGRRYRDVTDLDYEFELRVLENFNVLLTGRARTRNTNGDITVKNGRNPRRNTR
jgi:hypothetical protein